MAYRLRKRESISKGLKRVTRDELRSAIACLTGARPSDDSIHDARKRIKKVRAVLQLVANAIDAGRAPRQCLRSAGHALSPIRDVEAVIETAQDLCGRHGERLTAKTCAALGHTLESEKTRVRRAARRNHSIGQAVRSLRRVQRSTLDWDWKAVGASKLGSAIRRRYKKAQRQMRRARGSTRADTFHEWRKRIKTLWYSLRLVEKRVAVGRTLRELNRLENWLGDDHNLAVLRSRVEAADVPDRPFAGLARVQRLATQRQLELRRMALALASHVFAETPKAFEKHLQQT